MIALMALIAAVFSISVGCATTNNVRATIAQTTADIIDSQPIKRPVVVYNAVLAPTQSGTVNVVADGRRAHATFFIDKPDARNAIEPSDEKVSPELLKATGNVVLTVAMTCSFCEAPTVSSQSMVFMPDKMYSTYAEFEFTPVLKNIDSSTAVGQLRFQVFRGATQVDFVAVNVRVVPAEQLESQALIPQPVSSKSAPSLGFAPWQRPIDLTLTFRFDAFQQLQVALIGSEEIDRLFNAKNREKDGTPRYLNTGLKKNELSTLAAKMYRDLFATINNDGALRRKLAGVSASSVPSISSILITDTDKKALVKALAYHGSLWYKYLFVTRGADVELRTFVSLFEKYPSPDRPRRIRIESQGIYLPWQLLTPSPSDQPDENSFWGFRYELTVEPLPGPELGPISVPGPLLYGRYKSAIAGDVVATLADSHKAALADTLRFPNVITAESAAAFVDSLKQQRGTVDMIVTFTHGESGTVISSTGQVTEDVAGPKLIFSPTESLKVDDLYTLISALPLTEPYVFARWPVVFLNGCETGTAGFFATTNQDFVGTFLRMGSRAVVATESPIWTFFGYSFGIDFLNEIRSGTPVASALLKVRRQYLVNANNPLGLMYSNFGASDAALALQR